MQALARVMVRCAIQLRMVHLAFLVSSVAVWFDRYRDHPVAVAGAAGMFAWSVLVLILLRRQLADARPDDQPAADRHTDPASAADRHTDPAAGAVPGLDGEREDPGESVRIPPVLARLDVLMATVGVALAPWIVPDPVRGDPSSLVFVAALTAAVTAAFSLTWRALLGAVALLGVVHLVTGVGQRPQVFAATLILIVVATLLRYALVRLLRVADDADLRQQKSTARRRRMLVAEARERAAQESERLLHDTILNTLTGIGMAEDMPAGLLREQCAQSVREVEEHLGPRAVGARRSGPGLLERLARTVTQASAAGLKITVDHVSHDMTIDATADGTGVGWVPDEVATAVVLAAGEALRNVRFHAGTDEARVVTLLEPGRLRVSIVDRGRGFQPDEVAANSVRLGLRSSVSARMRAVSGDARITSAPGQGTEITLAWDGPPRVPVHMSGWAEPASTAALPADGALPLDGAPLQVAGPSSGGAGATPAAESAAAAVDRIEEELSTTARRGFAVAVVVGWLASLIPVIIHRDQARSVPLSMVIWLATFLAIGATAWISKRRPLRPAEARGAVLLAIASAVGGAFNTVERPDEVIVCWATTMVNPLWLAFAVLSRRRRERYAAAGLAALAMTMLVLALGGRHDHLVLARLAGAVYGLIMMQVLVTMFGPVLRASAQERARSERLAAGVTDQRILDIALRQDREARLAQLDARFLPLLRDIAADRLDPNSPDTRARCTAQARALRRELTGAGPEVLADLAGPIEAAEARGVAVTVQNDGRFTAIPPAVGAELLARVSAVLSSIGRETVLLTAYLDADRAEIYLSYPVRAATASTSGNGRGPTLGDFGRFGEFGPAGAGLVRSTASMAEGVVCVELRWSADGTGPQPRPFDAPDLLPLGVDAGTPVVPSTMAGLRGAVRAGDESAPVGRGLLESAGRGMVEQPGGGGERRATFRRDQTDA
ncbi:ATP-binding protein [Frankia sp. AgPm24]|nr:ATP-binding protein [Frankia sp. AgPm24]